MNPSINQQGGMLIVTTENLAGHRITEVKGQVFGLVAPPEARAYAIKAAVSDPVAPCFEFVAHKTMYGGKHVRAGDVVYLFASENSGGAGLVARGVVTAAAPTPRRPGVERQTPRMSVTVQRTALARQALGRAELKRFTHWQDGQPQTELNFKLYRQATDKIVGLQSATAAFLDGHF